MHLSTSDIVVIVIYMVAMLTFGIVYRKYAGRNLSSFFLGSRNIPWWLAGASMIASSFAADTPLAVAEIVNKNGIAGNWIWWNALVGGMLTTFFFSRLWRKANILTDLEFIELRYSGKAASFLRGFKAIYLGIFMNAFILGWVNVALMTILEIFFGIPHEYVLWYIFGAMIFTAVYSILAGFLGVAISDFLEFLLGMGGTTVLAFIILNEPKVGGIDGLKSKLPSWTLDFFPQVSEFHASGDMVGIATISIGTFLAFISMQWWASWYPGAEPGGGGAVAQRMMSTKNEQHAIAATMFFQIYHFCLRPWPWIIVGLSVIILYPHLGMDEKRYGYVLAMRDYLPAGLKGLLVIAFFSSYISTISSQFNWGASYLVNDLFKRFYKPNASEKELVWASRIGILIMMGASIIITPMIKSIADVWSFVLQCSAGLGLVLILRWYWWRINAWSELIATIVPIFVYAFCRYVIGGLYPGHSLSVFPNIFFVTVGVTTVAWILATFLTKPTDKTVLQEFYRRIKPPGAWRAIRISLKMEKDKDLNLRSLMICWISSVAMAYGTLFFIGYLIFKEWNNAFVMLSLVSGSFVILSYHSKKNKIFHDTEQIES